MTSLSLPSLAGNPASAQSSGQTPVAPAGPETETSFSKMVIQAGLFSGQSSIVQSETGLPGVHPDEANPITLAEAIASEAPVLGGETPSVLDILADVNAGQTAPVAPGPESADAAPVTPTPARPQLLAFTPAALQALSVMQEQGNAEPGFGIAEGKEAPRPETLAGLPKPEKVGSLTSGSALPSRSDLPHVASPSAPDTAREVGDVAADETSEKPTIRASNAPISPNQDLTVQPGQPVIDATQAADLAPSLTVPAGMTSGLADAQPMLKAAVREGQGERLTALRQAKPVNPAVLVQAPQIEPAPAMSALVAVPSEMVDVPSTQPQNSPLAILSGMTVPTIKGDVQGVPGADRKSAEGILASVPASTEPLSEASLLPEGVKVLSVAKPAADEAAQAAWRPAAAAARMAGATLMAAPELVPIARSSGMVPPGRAPSEPRGAQDPASPLSPIAADLSRSPLIRAFPGNLPVGQASGPVDQTQRSLGGDPVGQPGLTDQAAEPAAALTSVKISLQAETAQIGKPGERITEPGQLTSGGPAVFGDAAGPAGAELRPEFAFSSPKEPVPIFAAASQSPLPQAAQAPLPQALASQISRHLQAGDVSNGTTRISFTDDTAGEIVIEMATDDAGQMRIMLRAENPALLHAIRTDRDILLQNLNQAGVSVDDRGLGFEDLGQRGRDGQSHQGASPQQKADRSAKLDLDPITPSRSGPVRSSAEPGRLDILT